MWLYADTLTFILRIFGSWAVMVFLCGLEKPFFEKFFKKLFKNIFKLFLQGPDFF